MPLEQRGVRALKIWCRRVCSSYSSVNILDMSSSWRDGLAFCAIIHHFRPNSIDFYSLSPENIFENNDLAFTIAEEELGIPSLLDPQDMVDSEIPDKFSIVTYVSQFYHLLKDEDNSCSPSLARSALKQAASDQEGSNDSSLEEDEERSPKVTPKCLPRALFSSTNPILRNNKFSPMNSPLSQSPKSNDLQISLSSQSHLKSSSGVTVSGVCEDFSKKIKIFQERKRR